MDPKQKQLLDSARSSQQMGEWAMLVGFAFLAIALLYGAYSIFRHGLKLSASKTLTGTPAKVVAVLLLVIAVALGALGIYLSRGLFR